MFPSLLLLEFPSQHSSQVKNHARITRSKHSSSSSLASSNELVSDFKNNHLRTPRERNRKTCINQTSFSYPMRCEIGSRVDHTLQQTCLLS